MTFKTDMSISATYNRLLSHGSTSDSLSTCCRYINLCLIRFIECSLSAACRVTAVEWELHLVCTFSVQLLDFEFFPGACLNEKRILF